jgi:PhzF family phenazine biosynthesis protein
VASLTCVDAFTSEQFRGNPAAVCLLDEPGREDPSDEWMQSLAAEMNLSETAFVAPRPAGSEAAGSEAGGSGVGRFGLRWFTPTQEVLLCGHATLASAHVLWESGALDEAEPARFHTRWKGELVATRAGDGIALDLPTAASAVVPEPEGLSAALGTAVLTVAANDLHHLVELADERSVRTLTPDFSALAAVEVEAVAVTAPSDDEAYDFVSRYFTPRHGILEDPVTGSAHTSLGPWWAERLGRPDVVGYQASARGGVVRVHAEPGAPRVSVSGDAVTVWTGFLAR